MKQGFFKIVENTSIAKNVYQMILQGDTSAITKPGQFVNLKIDGCFLRRPISVCDVEDNRLTLIYKVVGEGTEKLSQMQPGGALDLLTGLGNGYDLSRSGQNPLLIGGGVGVPPLYLLCRQLIAQGKKPTVILGFNCADEIFYQHQFAQIAPTLIATADGSVGVKGFVTDALKQVEAYTYFYTCGPEPMLKAVYQATQTSGQFSFEERMGCGFGACMGCSCKTKYGNKRICKDGPVLDKEEIIW